ncbi:hypothetical protein KDK_07760 [Dictyobacter kobayashii]|uniref:Uncharacterized protein n=1 Tax=Dictyobacter kobayashii TaxID=2014872 RepID=A0A402AD20_9CHLR|nr:hypothetical protein KDK_07760 [Dictyobacter kobayashii]
MRGWVGLDCGGMIFQVVTPGFATFTIAFFWIQAYNISTVPTIEQLQFTHLIRPKYVLL